MSVHENGAGRLQVHRYGAAKVSKAKTTQSQPVTHTRVDRGLWAEALRMAEDDPARIQIQDATTVIVWNNANWPNKKRRRKQ